MYITVQSEALTEEGNQTDRERVSLTLGATLRNQGVFASPFLSIQEVSQFSPNTLCSSITNWNGTVPKIIVKSQGLRSGHKGLCMGETGNLAIWAG